MAADHQDLFGMFGAANFSDDVRGFDRSIRKCILNVESHMRRDPAIQIAFQLPLILSGHRNYRDGKICVKFIPMAFPPPWPPMIAIAPAGPAARIKSPMRINASIPILLALPLATTN